MSSQHDAPQTAICTADGVSLVQIQVNARVPETRVSATVAADSVTTYGDGRHLIDLQQENVRRRRGHRYGNKERRTISCGDLPSCGCLGAQGVGAALEPWAGAFDDEAKRGAKEAAGRKSDAAGATREAMLAPRRPNMNHQRVRLFSSAVLLDFSDCALPMALTGWGVGGFMDMIEGWGRAQRQQSLEQKRCGSSQAASAATAAPRTSSSHLRCIASSEKIMASVCLKTVS